MVYLCYLLHTFSFSESPNTSAICASASDILSVCCGGELSRFGRLPSCASRSIYDLSIASLSLFSNIVSLYCFF